MIDLTSNVYNRRQGRSESKLKLWRYAGLLLTYRCSAACRFCSYYCSPRGEGLMPVEMALEAWTSLVKLAGQSAHIHITGGEPFLFFDHLVAMLSEARRQNLPPLNCLETNGAWAVSEVVIREKMRFLKEMGLEELNISFDPFHADFVSVDAILALRTIAREILGPDHVRIRWEKYLENPIPFSEYLKQDQKLLARMLKDDRCRFTGRAAEEIAPLAADKSIEQLANLNCRNAILGARGIHIDPFGNVFCGQCSGIIVGNLQTKSLEALWQEFDPPNLQFWSRLFDFGPTGLLEEAIRKGVQPRDRYASKCHLCSDIRRFFFDKGIFLSIIGPKGCYGL
jgi:MoaA/NifB/PqqE/SkfB family radical SAM enzyme